MIMWTFVPLLALEIGHEKVIGFSILAIGIYVALVGVVAWWRAP